MTELICIRCPHARFLDPKKEICYRTGGLFCGKLREIVGKYETCRARKMGPPGPGKAPKRRKKPAGDAFS